jgi:C-terminal processing protease CtpA/Prc
MLSFVLANGSPILLKGIGVVLSPFIAVHNLIKTTKRDDKIYYRFKQSKPQQPKGNPYKGNIYVLINGNSFSASSIISTHLKATNRATFVGQETGGAYNGTVAGIFKNYKLPHSNIRVNMGLMQVEAPYKIEPNGYGVLPDVEIKSSLVDFENKKDAAIDWVLNSIDKTN